MDKIKKYLRKLTVKERKIIFKKLDLLEKRQIRGLDIRKIKNTHYFRLRVGDHRVVFYYENNKFKLLHIRDRNDHTYKNL